MLKNVLLLSALVLVSGCGMLMMPTADNERERRYTNPNDYVSIPPAGRKKRRAAIHPNVAFISALKSYRISKGAFPAELWQFEASGDDARNAMRYMKEGGFKEMNIEYLYLDSLVIGFMHVDKYKQRIRREDYDVTTTGKMIFTFGRDSAFVTRTVLDKRKGLSLR